MQPFDGDRSDESCGLPNVEALLPGIHPTADPLTGQASADILVLAVYRKVPIDANRARKRLLMDLPEPAVRIHRRLPPLAVPERPGKPPEAVDCHTTVPDEAVRGCNGTSKPR
jgi:hypothetical protein